MRSIGRVAGAVPRSNSRCASGCVLPFSTFTRDSSRAWVISGRGAGKDADADCCAAAGEQRNVAVKITARRKMKRSEDTTGLSDEAGRARIETPQPGIDNAHRNKRTEEGDGIPFTLLRPKAVGHATVQQPGEIFNAGFRHQISGIMLSFILGNR